MMKALRSIFKRKKNKSRDEDVMLFPDERFCEYCQQLLLRSVITDCKHRFCFDCICSALSVATECPVCYTKLYLGMVQSTPEHDIYLNSFTAFRNLSRIVDRQKSRNHNLEHFNHALSENPARNGSFEELFSEFSPDPSGDLLEEWYNGLNARNDDCSENNKQINCIFEITDEFHDDSEHEDVVKTHNLSISESNNNRTSDGDNFEYILDMQKMALEIGSYDSLLKKGSSSSRIRASSMSNIEEGRSFSKDYFFYSTLSKSEDGTFKFEKYLNEDETPEKVRNDSGFKENSSEYLKTVSSETECYYEITEDYPEETVEYEPNVHEYEENTQECEKDLQNFEEITQKHDKKVQDSDKNVQNQDK